MRHLATFAGLALAAIGAHAQLNKCVDAGGRVTYSDLACPTASAASAIKAPPIAEPTARDAYAAQVRRIDDNHRAAMADLDRQLERLRPAPGATSLGGDGPRGLPRRATDADSARCVGIRHQLRRGRIRDPLNFDHTIQAIELQRAEQRYCDR